VKRSRSGIFFILKVWISVVLAASAILVPTSMASAADADTPLLSSFSISATDVTPGQQVTFSYVATEGADSLSRLRLHYMDKLGHSYEVLSFVGPLPVAGSVTFTVPDTWWNGLATLDFVELADPTGNTINYLSFGRALVSPAGASGPSSHTVPFTPGDMTVSGSTKDVMAPTLNSVSVGGSPAHPGDTISINYAATDAAGSLGSVAFFFHDAYQITRSISPAHTASRPLNGVIDVTIPATWPNGTYLLNGVRVADPQGNTAMYLATGVVVKESAGSQGPTSHTVDFGAATFVVQGAADLTPPLLTGLSLTGSPMLPGGTATVSYTVEPQHRLDYISFTYFDLLGKKWVFEAGPGQVTGTTPISFPVGGPIGSVRLTSVFLRDSAGNTITYLSDGTTTQTPLRIAGKHTLPLPTLNLLVGTPPSVPTAVSARARSASAVVSWEPANTLGSAISSYTVTAQPGGRTFTTDGSATYAELTGLTNGTAYRFTVKATNALGSGAASAPSVAVTPMMSTNIFAAGDFDRDGHSDIIGLRASADPTNLDRPSYLYRGNGRSGFAGMKVLRTTFTAVDKIVFSPGDFTGDGFSDVMMVHTDGGNRGDYPGVLALDAGNGHGDLQGHGYSVVGSGWGKMRNVFGPGDFSGDRKNDVMAITSAGDLYLYRGNRFVNFVAWSAPGQKIGRGWGGFLTVFSRGDFSGDGKIDVMAVSKDGGVYLYRGNGRGGFAAAGQRIGNGWGNFLSVFSPGDFSGDGKTDVIAVTSTGDMLLYRGNGRGGWAGGSQKIGSGWNNFR